MVDARNTEQFYKSEEDGIFFIGGNRRKLKKAYWMVRTSAWMFGTTRANYIQVTTKTWPLGPLSTFSRW